MELVSAPPISDSRHLWPEADRFLLSALQDASCHRYSCQRWELMKLLESVSSELFSNVLFNAAERSKVTDLARLLCWEFVAYFKVLSQLSFGKLYRKGVFTSPSSLFLNSYWTNDPELVHKIRGSTDLSPSSCHHIFYCARECISVWLIHHCSTNKG